MKSFLVILTATIVFGSIIILLIEGKAVYNEFLAYSFFKQLKNKKFKKAFNTIHLIVGRRIRAYLTIELVKGLLNKNRIEQAYYIFKRVKNTLLKIIILELIIDNCLKNNDNVKLDAFISIAKIYENEKFIELYKRVILYYEHTGNLEKLIELENLDEEVLNFQIALSYIKLEAFDELQRIVYKIGNAKKIGLLTYETFKYYKEINQIGRFDSFFENLKLDEKTKLFMSEFIVKIYIEMGKFDSAEKKMIVMDFRKKLDYYFLIAKDLMGKDEQNYYIEKCYELINFFVFPSEKIIALIKLTYLTINQVNYKEKNKYLDEAYSLYLVSNNVSIDMTKEFILLFRLYKKYDVFMDLLEKKAEIYKEAIGLENMNSIEPEFTKSINSFLWGEELEVFEEFMKSYNIVQLKNGQLNYDDFFDLVHQIKRYVSNDTFEKFNKITLNLFNKPNTMFFINQHIKSMKNL